MECSEERRIRFIWLGRRDWRKLASITLRSQGALVSLTNLRQHLMDHFAAKASGREEA